MWQCPNCDEQLEAQFDSCWKCGTMADGGRDPDFVVTEPVRPVDQAAVPQVDASERPTLELPTMTYFAIPLSFAMMVAQSIWQMTTSQGFSIGISPAQLPGSSSVSPFEIVSAIVFTILFGGVIGIPVFINFIRTIPHLRHDICWPWQKIPSCM